MAPDIQGERNFSSRTLDYRRVKLNHLLERVNDFEPARQGNRGALPSSIANDRDGLLLYRVDGSCFAPLVCRGTATLAIAVTRGVVSSVSC